MPSMSDADRIRLGEAAEILGVSPDTVRRWVDAGRLAARRDEHGHRMVAGADLAAFARARIESEDSPGLSSARNRLRGIVTEAGATAITITHDMTSVRTIADRVALLDQGRVRWQGTVAQMDEAFDPMLRAFVRGEPLDWGPLAGQGRQG